MASFLIDRSLGGVTLQQILRTTHHADVKRVAEHFPYDDDEGVPDPSWLEFAGDQERAVLTKDKGIRTRSLERLVVCKRRLIVFCIASGNLSGVKMNELYLAYWSRIIVEADRDGPVFFHLSSHGMQAMPLNC
ncbi:MAG: hypothetical protein ACRD0K_10750 [Egibacteraceae bacterium]